MTIEEQRRKAYEEWEVRENGYRPEDFSRVNGEYRYSIFREGFARWNSALDSLVIELPGYAMDYAFNDAIDECRAAIESAGLKVKPCS